MNNVLQTSNCNEVRDQWIKIERDQSLWEFAIRQNFISADKSVFFKNWYC